jgi:transcriptional regulator with XRE-family HTH domain
LSDISKLPLKALRARANLTQQQVAVKVGVNRLTYGQWENYKTFPDALQLMKLSQIFGCSMDTFYFPLIAS